MSGVLSDVLSGALINISVESLIIGVRDGAGIDKLDDVLINVLTSEAVDIGIDMLVGAGIIVLVDSTEINLGFNVSSVSYAVVLVEVWLDVLNDVGSGDMTILTASGIGVDMFADEDANVFAAGMTDLTFVVSTPLTGSVPSC